jgi:hypothetical protein
MGGARTTTWRPSGTRRAKPVGVACTSPSGRSSRRSRPISWIAVGSALLAVLLPKCPLCVGAYLSMLGLTAGAAGVALHVLRPLGVLLAGLALAWMLLARRRASGGRYLVVSPCFLISLVASSATSLMKESSFRGSTVSLIPPHSSLSSLTE